MNLNDIGGQFLEQKQTKNPATISHVAKISYYFYNKKVESIRYQDVLDYIVMRRKQKAKAATINREISILKQMLGYLVRTGVLQSNPAAEIKMEKNMTIRDRWITPEEETRLVEAAPIWLKPVIIFAAATGMRRGEILKLTKEQVDIPGKTVIILKSKNGRPRIIPLTTRALEALRIADARRIREKTLIFVDRTDKQIPEAILEYNFKIAAAEAGLDDLHFHDLRHTFATRLVQRGVELYAVQRLLGHLNSSMTTRYAHHSIESLRKAVEA
jgi:site-specific recombinase XerD